MVLPAETMSATEFKAKCLDILDRVGRGEIERLSITKRGAVVAVLVPPPGEPEPQLLYGFMRGSVVLPPELDLTEPICQDVPDAESGKLFE